MKFNVIIWDATCALVLAALLQRLGATLSADGLRMCVGQKETLQDAAAAIKHVIWTARILVANSLGRREEHCHCMMA